MRIKNVVWLLAVVFFLTSCANMPLGGNQQSSTLDNSEEMTIFFQAVGVGAGIGLGVGLLACNNLMELNELERIACNSATTLIGGGIGYLVAQQQMNNLNQVRLQNNELNAMLNKARQYNRDIASYNASLKQEIRQLRQSRGNDPRYIANRLKAAQYKRSKVAEALEMRRKLVAKLSDHNQKRQYQQTLSQLNSESSRLNASIRELEQINGRVYIGA